MTENYIDALSINLSGRTIEEGSLANVIIDQIDSSGIEPSRLIFEITETSSISNISKANQFFSKLKEKGCRVSLDDFGSGFASFSYLKYLQVDTLKIDGEFILDLPSNKENQVFVKSMIDIANSLHIDCVAEYVEDIETLKVLRELGVNYAQGYLFGKPARQLQRSAVSSDALSNGIQAS